MGFIDIEIIGLPQLIQFFNSTAPRAIENSVSESLTEVANEIQSITTGLVPVDTGALRNSIKVSKLGDGIEASAGKDYASYVDEGTSRMSAQPFFTQPIENIMQGFSSKIERRLSASLTGR